MESMFCNVVECCGIEKIENVKKTYHKILTLFNFETQVKYSIAFVNNVLFYILSS